jgi:type IV pilus assembly protein PilM
MQAMSFLQTEIPSPRKALSAIRNRPSTGKASKQKHQRPARAGRVSGRAGVVGLDIEPGFVTAVETAPGSVAVRRAAVMELAPDVVRDGEVVDPQALGVALKDFFAEHQLPSRVRIGLANQRIVMRTVDLPPITDDRQLASAVRFQAQEHIAMPLEQAVLDFQSLGLVGTADGPRSRVVLVAARREMVERFLEACRVAGLRLEGIDLSAFATIRALHRPGDGDAQVAYLNIGSVSNLTVASGTQCLFTRVIPFGAESMVADLAARRGLTSEHARGWLGRSPAPLRSGRSARTDPHVAATREVLEDGAARMATEIRTTLDFYATQTGGALTDRAIITGTGASVEGAAERVAAELGIPVEVRTVTEHQDGAFHGIDPARLTVAAGLTTTEAPA